METLVVNYQEKIKSDQLFHEKTLSDIENILKEKEKEIVAKKLEVFKLQTDKS